MSRGKLERERRRRRRQALHLLTADGAVRPANVVVCYRGSDRLLKTWSRDTDRLGSEALVHQRSIWHTDLRELWNTDLRKLWNTDLRDWWNRVSARISATIRHAERSSRVKATLGKVFQVTTS
jgi:hypothetical protein